MIGLIGLESLPPCLEPLPTPHQMQHAPAMNGVTAIVVMQWKIERFATPEARVSDSRISKQHAVNRTSPKGQPFLGTCSLCGQTGMSIMQAMQTECPNQRGLTPDEALLETLHDRR